MKISKNLIEHHRNLQNFAEHHQNKGKQDTLHLISRLWSDIKQSPRDGSPEGMFRNEGFDTAMKLVQDSIKNTLLKS